MSIAPVAKPFLVYGADPDRVVLLAPGSRVASTRFSDSDCYARAAAWFVGHPDVTDEFGPYRLIGYRPDAFRASLVVGAAMAGTSFWRNFARVPEFPNHDLDPFELVGKSRFSLGTVLYRPEQTVQLVPDDYAAGNDANRDARIALELASRLGYLSE